MVESSVCDFDRFFWCPLFKVFRQAFDSDAAEAIDREQQAQRSARKPRFVKLMTVLGGADGIDARTALSRWLGTDSFFPCWLGQEVL